MRRMGWGEGGGGGGYEPNYPTAVWAGQMGMSREIGLTGLGACGCIIIILLANRASEDCPGLPCEGLVYVGWRLRSSNSSSQEPPTETGGYVLPTASPSSSSLPG